MTCTDKVRAAVESAYDGICSIIEYQSVRGSDGICRQQETVVWENIPCKLSFELNYPVSQTDTVAVASQRAKLFVAPEISVKNGSKIIVEQYGKKAEYGFSGETAVYPTHREIRVSPFVKRA